LNKDLHHDTFELLGNDTPGVSVEVSGSAAAEVAPACMLLDTLEIDLEQKTKITFPLGSANIKRFCNS
jgi:hypothetical protein